MPIAELLFCDALSVFLVLGLRWTSVRPCHIIIKGLVIWPFHLFGVTEPKMIFVKVRRHSNAGCRNSVDNQIEIGPLY